jgi:2-oxoglutarate ferredoxin oxidoreductase subunit alpha
VRGRGGHVATAHLVHLNPFPRNLGDVLAAFPKVFVPELNMGQLVKMVRADLLVPAESYTKVQGLPFAVAEIEREMERRI